MSKRQMLPQSVRFTVFRRDNFTCRYCGRQSPAVVLHIEHVEAVANGGTDDLANLVTSCQECNGGKGVMAGVVPPAPLEAPGPVGLAGMCAHELDEQGYANRQMRIVRSVGDGRWIVQYYSWLTGEPNECGVIAEADLLSDRYAPYLDCDDMNYAYEHGKRNRAWRSVG